MSIAGAVTNPVRARAAVRAAAAWARGTAAAAVALVARGPEALLTEAEVGKATTSRAAGLEGKLEDRLRAEAELRLVAAELRRALAEMRLAAEPYKAAEELRTRAVLEAPVGVQARAAVAKSTVRAASSTPFPTRPARGTPRTVA
jgi:hypothetical protein